MWRILRPDALVVWESENVRSSLSHYYGVLTGSRPAKFRVVKRVPVECESRNLEDMWRIHDDKVNEFRELYLEVEDEPSKMDKMPMPPYSLLDLKVDITYKLLESCVLCEWRCGVNRIKGRNGVCGLNSEVRVASAFLHMGEEAPLVPSGTIFFTGCSFKCVFCQNWDISTNPSNGTSVTPKELAAIAVKLYKEGARNINYVGGNPDQQLHVILASLRYMDSNVPLLWNSNMYMSSESLKLLVDVIDIWLPDFKYGNNRCAMYLSKVPNYFDVVSRNHSIASRHGDIIIRHLVLPGHIECCTKPVLKWISENCPRALVNIMDQYRPEHLVSLYPVKFKDIARRPSVEELREAHEYADSLGIKWKEVS
ncbi:MAG: radical SAM protein [Thermofilaceae archaeon]|nr:radical SAM protein [Thermofilaceae archaeon]MCX8180587.1 radical SAM protein [Thermofilaceae archaeon]MDW8003689.1 radical SAM protein [Thermofilaceae archaeon]